MIIMMMLMMMLADDDDDADDDITRLEYSCLQHELTNSLLKKIFSRIK
jgi:hypothetical protein